MERTRIFGGTVRCLCAAIVTSVAIAVSTYATVPFAIAQTAGSISPADVPLTRTYQVGEGVYVRSLAVEARNKSLWVGTSVGAMNIDLATRDLKQVFTREDGLANEYIFAIAVDPQSGTWFGTNAGGMSKHDAGSWQTFFPMHGLADYWVYAFAFDGQERLWVGTWDGASLFDKQTGTFTTYREELVNIWVYGIDIDDQGRVWFGTEGGVSMFDGAQWRSWTHADGLGAENLGSLPASENTGLGTRSRHDLSIDVDAKESYNPNYVFAALVDNRQRGIWFGTWGAGISLFDGEGTWRNYTTKDGLAGNVVYSIAQSPDGTIWAGTNNGVSRFDGEQWQSYTHGLGGKHFYAVAIDGDGTVWLGTRGAVTALNFHQ